MNKSIEKIIAGLKTLYEGTKYIMSSNDDVKDFKNEIGLFTIWMENEKPLNKYRVISDNLALVNLIINSSKSDQENFYNFKDKDITNIFLYFINKNIENGILDETSTFIDCTQYGHKNNITINNKHKKLTIFEEFKILMIKEMDGYIKKPNEVYQITHISKKRLEEIKKTHKIIKEHYLNKLDTFDKTDIEAVINAIISAWPKTTHIIKAVKNTLEQKLSKRKLEIQKTQIEIKREERVSKPILTKKQYHEIKDELDSKFDFERMEPRIDVTLTPEEIEYCINLMNQLSFTNREKEIFLEKSFKKTREELLNIDSIMRLLQSQIEFYNINSETVNKAMYNLELYIEEYKGTEDLIEKEEWFELIKEEIRIVNAFIPKTFEYEKSLLLEKKVN